MADSGNAFRKQHDLTEENIKDENVTPEDQDEEQIVGGEENTELDALHNRAFGDDGNSPIGDEINKDEVSRVKNLSDEEQEETPES